MTRPDKADVTGPVRSTSRIILLAKKKTTAAQMMRKRAGRAQTRARAQP